MEQKQYDDFFLALNSVAVVYKATLKPVDIPKNGVIQKAFAMHYQNNPVVPIFYPDRLINPELSRTPGQIASALSRTVMPEIAELWQNPNLSFSGREQAVSHLRSTLIGYGNNRPFLQGIPYERTADLALYARLDFGNGVAAPMTEKALSFFRMTKEEALSEAKKNTYSQARLHNFHTLLKAIYRETGLDEKTAQMIIKKSPKDLYYFLNTKDGWEGAAPIADPAILKKLREFVGGDYYILPASVHKVWILTKAKWKIPPEKLKMDMVPESQQGILPQDILSNNLYEFDGRGLSIVGAQKIERDTGIAEHMAHRHSR